MPDFQSFLNFSWGGNTGFDYVRAVVLFVVTLIVLKVFQRVVVTRLQRFAERTRNQLGDLLVDLLKRLGSFFYLSVALYAGIMWLVLPPFLNAFVAKVVFVIVVWYSVRIIQDLVKFGFARFFARKENVSQSVGQTVTGIVQITLWVIALLMVLSTWGINVTSVIAGFGIGGIAVAFAFQHILEDIFSSFSIFIDKPFREGDFIIIGEDKGTVKKIGIKSTRIESFQGQELIVSNRELTSARINNYGYMNRRRISFVVSVVYDTPPATVKKISGMLRDILQATEHVEPDRVHFKELGPSSLNFEVVYYVDSGEHARYMDVQQSINLAIMEAFEKENIQFAYTTQNVRPVVAR